MYIYIETKNASTSEVVSRKDFSELSERQAQAVLNGYNNSNSLKNYSNISELKKSESPLPVFS